MKKIDKVISDNGSGKTVNAKFPRHDFSVIASMIERRSYVLDLGCAEGGLLQYLRDKKDARVRGVEQNFPFTVEVLRKKIPIFQGDILQGMEQYADNTFDVAVLSRTVQELSDPDLIITKMLEKAKRAIVSFLNYGYYKNRWYGLWTGKKPITHASSLPWPFHNEVKPLSIKDFEDYSLSKGYKILRKHFLDGAWEKPVRLFPNLTCGVAIFMLEQGKNRSLVDAEKTSR